MIELVVICLVHSFLDRVRRLVLILLEGSQILGCFLIASCQRDHAVGHLRPSHEDGKVVNDGNLVQFPQRLLVFFLPRQ